MSPTKISTSVLLAMVKESLGLNCVWRSVAVGIRGSRWTEDLHLFFDGIHMRFLLGRTSDSNCELEGCCFIFLLGVWRTLLLLLTFGWSFCTV